MSNPARAAFVFAVVLVGCGGQGDPASHPPAGSGIAATAGSAGTAGTASAAAATTGAPLKINPGLVTGKLANGLTYYVLHNAKPEKRAELWLAVDAGSVLEDEDQRGIAHFVEHMAFNGTKKYAKQEIIGWLEKSGMKFGPDVNARTEFDSTVYQIEVPTDDPALVTHGLDVLHEWSSAIAFAPDRVEKERGVILEEKRLRGGAPGRLLDQIVPAALPGSKYGQRLPIGLEQIIKTVTPDTLKRFYHDWYRPDLMAVIVVGDVDAAAVKKQIEDQFADLKTPADAKPRPDVPIPPQAKTVTITASDPELPITLVAIASKQPQLVPRTDSDARKAMVSQLYSTMLNQRLDEISQKDTSPFVTARVGKQPLMRPIDVWFQGAVVKGNKISETLEVLATESARVAKFGFVDSELARAKQDLLHRIEVEAKEKDKTVSSERVEDLVRMFLSGVPFTDPEDMLALAQKLMPGITAAEVQAVASIPAGEADRVVVVASTAGTELPKQAALLATLAAGQTDAKAPYVDDVAKGPLVPTPPAPGTIGSASERAELGVTEWTLSNGVQVSLKPTDFQNDNVSLRALLVGGSSLATDADFIAAANVASIIETSGAGSASAVQLHKTLAGTGVDVHLVVSPVSEVVVGSAQPEHLEQLLQLVYLRLSTPRKDADAINAWRAQEVSARWSQLDDPGTAFEAKFDDVASSGHPRFRLQTSADFAQLDVDRALAFYQARLAHLGGLHVTIVGNFKLDAIKPLILTYLGGLPAGPAEHWSDPHVTRPSGTVTFEVDQGLDPKATVKLWFHTAMPWTREAEHDDDALGEALAIRLREELREGMSGTYGVGVDTAFERAPGSMATLTIKFSCAPENADKLTAAAKAVIASFVKDGPPQLVIDKIKETERRERETALKTNEFWLEELVTSYLYGDDPAHVLTDGKLIDAITLASVRDAAKRYLGKDYVLGVLKSKPKTDAPPPPKP